jgi:hypothetical protein
MHVGFQCFAAVQRSDCVFLPPGIPLNPAISPHLYLGITGMKIIGNSVFHGEKTFPLQRNFDTGKFKDSY